MDGETPFVSEDVGERVGVRVPDREGVLGGEGVALGLVVGVRLALAPRVTELVGVGDAEDVCVPERVMDGVPVVVWEGVRELVGVMLAVAPLESEAVGVRVVVAVGEGDVTQIDSGKIKGLKLALESTDAEVNEVRTPKKLPPENSGTEARPRPSRKEASTRRYAYSFRLWLLT